MSWRGDETTRLPAFSEPAPRAKPPDSTEGLGSATQGVISLWHHDMYRFPPYMYNECYTVEQGGERRTPSADENEILMGFYPGYTARAADLKVVQSSAYEDNRSTWLVQP